MAQHSKPSRPCKTRKIDYRLSEADYARLAALAAETDMSVNQLARALAISGIKTLVIEVQASCDPALLKQLHHIGHNLNQLVKNAHIFGRVSPQVSSLCQRIDALITKAAIQGSAASAGPIGKKKEDV